MAKQVKSVRMDEDLLNVFDSYSNLLQEMFGYSLSLSSIVNEALADFLASSACRWTEIMESQTVVETFPDGKVRKYEFSEEQIKKMREIENFAGSISASYQPE